jgi:hypothetical protein
VTSTFLGAQGVVRKHTPSRKGGVSPAQRKSCLHCLLACAFQCQNSLHAHSIKRVLHHHAFPASTTRKSSCQALCCLPLRTAEQHICTLHTVAAAMCIKQSHMGLSRACHEPTKRPPTVQQSDCRHQPARQANWHFSPTVREAADLPICAVQHVANRLIQTKNWPCAISISRHISSSNQAHIEM